LYFPGAFKALSAKLLDIGNANYFISVCMTEGGKEERRNADKSLFFSHLQLLRLISFDQSIDLFIFSCHSLLKSSLSSNETDDFLIEKRYK